MKLINVRQPSFLSAENIQDTIQNCLIAIGGQDSVEITDICFTESDKVVPHGLSPVADVNFTISKKEEIDNSVFLDIIAKFNS